MRQKRLRTPFVITVAGSIVACGGSTTGKGSGAATLDDSGAGGSVVGGDGGRSPGGSGGAPGGSGGSGGSLVSDGGSAGSIGGSAGTCPTVVDYSTPGGECLATCTQNMQCASGTQTLTLHCEPGAGTTVEEPCEHQWDHCRGEGYYPVATCASGHWHLEGAGGNPPAPCPAEPPVAGTPCRPGGFGGDREACAYPCFASAPTALWTVLSCTPPAFVPDGGDYTSTWRSDGACAPDAGATPQRDQ